MSRIMAQIKHYWQAERSRHFLWVPVCFAVGIGVYLGLGAEPPLWIVPMLLVLAFAVALVLWERAPMLVTALVIAGAGFCWSLGYTRWEPHHVLTSALQPRPVIGIVEDIVRTEHGVRITLDQVQVQDLAAEDTPEQVRISVRIKKGTDPELPHIGDKIGMMAGLRPPMGPALPHGFDFGRYFYFRDIGAVGYGLPPWEVLTPNAAPGIGTNFRDWRLSITEDIIHRLGTGTGGIAAGLITGDARAISEQDFNALRASNLYHIVAISGEHMMVIAGVIFVSLRMLALLLPRRIALRPQVKTITASITLLLVTAYLFVTGLPISAIRAYVMIFLVLLAVILRRRVDTMRSLAITALVMLVVQPANLLDPGFQLSFAATLAIISLVEAAILVPQDTFGESRWRKAVRLVVTMLLVSVVAEIATTPLVIAQFNNLSLYGVFANMLATPVMSLYLMPTVALYFILLPFGLSHAALWLMQWGIKALVGIGYFVASLPNAQMFAPSLPHYGVAIFALGLMWVCLWRQRWRWYGTIAMVLGVLSIFTTHMPDMLIGGEGKQIAFRSEGEYVLARGRTSSMIPTLWANGLGYDQLEKADAPNWQCDPLGCVARVAEKRVAFVQDPAALIEDCARADVIIAPIAQVKCARPVTIIDQSTLKNSNVIALRFMDGRVAIETSADWQGKRAWSIGADDAANEAD